MIIDNEDRTVRYVELDAAGGPVAENFHSGPSRRKNGSSRSEEEWFTDLVAAAAKKGHTIVRLCNHEDDCANPSLNEIEGDGEGGIKARAGYTLDGCEMWDPSMERKFVLARDERVKEELYRVVRMERNEWTQAMLDDGDFFITKEGRFDWRRRVKPGPPTPKEAVSSAEALLESMAGISGDTPDDATFKPPGHGSFH